MRIDVYLSESGMVSSRTEAKRYICEGRVLVSGKPVTKPSFDVCGLEDKIVLIEEEERFVGRGGIKLKGALDAFGISPLGKLCIDVGASSGGFTDCLLKNGAKHVIAVDSGKDQLDPSLRNNPSVTSIEGYNARYMKSADLEYSPELAVMDVSFISATYIIPQLVAVLAPGADYVLLIKPQFEVGRERIGKGGIVKDEAARKSAVKKVVDCALASGFDLIGVIESPIRGGDGNVEFLAHFVKRSAHLE